MPTEILTFRKKPILKITDKDNPLVKIQFGLKKAKLLIDNHKEIIEFYNANIQIEPSELYPNDSLSKSEEKNL